MTQFLAIWGAITGTIGTIFGLISLIIKVKEYNKNKVSIRCDSKLEYSNPEKLDIKIIVKCLGKSPITLEKIRFYIMPRKFIHRFFRFYLHIQGRGFCELELFDKPFLKEATCKSIKIEPIRGIEMYEVYKAFVIDHKSKLWRVYWPSRSTLKKIASKEVINRDEIKINSKTITFICYRLGVRYYLDLQYNYKTRSGRTSQFWWFSNLDSLNLKLADIKENQHQKITRGEIDEII